jgi:hypothetical protein
MLTPEIFPKGLSTELQKRIARNEQRRMELTPLQQDRRGPVRTSSRCNENFRIELSGSQCPDNSFAFGSRKAM